MPYQLTAYADKVVTKRIGAPQVGGGKRGKVGYFSRGSRRRMLGMLAECREDFARALFVTLTYPGNYPTDPAVFKRDLDTILKRWARRGQRVRGLWRLEFQKRGAPHYHLLVWGLPDNIAWVRRWISRSWFSIVGSGDERHLRAGTNVQRIESRKHAGRYVSKYAAKAQETPIVPETGEVIRPGRYWGVWGELDRRPGFTAIIGDHETVELRRIMKHLLKSRGRAKSAKSAKYADRLVRQSPLAGWHVFGAGDMSCDEWETITDSTIWKAVMQVIISTGEADSDPVRYEH